MADDVVRPRRRVPRPASVGRHNRRGIVSGAFLVVVLAELVTLVRGLFAKPYLRSDYCDFPEQCLDIFQHDAFATARWIWWAGVVVAAVAVVVKVASGAAPRLARSWAVGAATLLFVATGFLTPVLWDTAASRDSYGGVTILSVQYLLALLLLQISALLLVHDITGWRIAPRQDRQPAAGERLACPACGGARHDDGSFESVGRSSSSCSPPRRRRSSRR